MFFIKILLTITVYSMACVGFGSAIFLFLYQNKTKGTISSWIEFSSKFLIGQGVLANLWVFLAMAGFFSALVVKSIIAVFFVVGILLNRFLFNELLKQLQRIWKEVMVESSGWKLLIVSTLTIWLLWLPFWFPLQTSGSRYYMAIAKVISASEHLMILPGYEDVASLGMQGEMQFAALMTLGSPESTQVFSWLTLTTGCILLLAIGRQIGLKRRGQWITLAMVFTSSSVILLSGSGKTDLYGAAFAFAAYYWALNFEEENRIQSSILIGLFSGMAIMAKLNYAVNFLPSLAIILFWKVCSQSGKISFKSHILPFFVMSICGFFIVIQMPIKNQLLFGDSLAVFHSEDISSQVWYGAETIRRIYLLLPFSLTFGAFWGQGGGISLLMLAFLPLLFFLPKPRQWLESPLFVLSFAAIFGLTFWFLIYPSNFALRYFLACALLLCLPTAKAAEVFVDFGKFNQRFVQASVIILILYTILAYVSFPLSTDGTLHQILTGEANCSNEKMRCLIDNEVNERLEPGERIFTYTRHRYWLRPDLIQCASTTEEIDNYVSLGSPELRWKYLVGRGFHSVLVENRTTSIPDIIRADLREIPDWLNINTLQDDENIFYFQLIPKDDSFPSFYKCGQLNQPAWDVFEMDLP